ncbi:iojap protein [Yersinia aldovae]|nr:iojap protein [Yersinia aldovae]
MSLHKLSDSGEKARLTPSNFQDEGYGQKSPEGEPLQGKALQEFVIDKLDDLKGQDITTLDVQGKSSITDYMIICTGTSTRHVMALADNLVQESRLAGMIPLGVEGQGVSDWVVVDLGEVIVHVMQEESRRMYELEKLWS